MASSNDTSSTTTLPTNDTDGMQIPVGLSSLLIRVVTYNIRYAATGSSLQDGEQVWDGIRGPRVTSQLRFTTLNTPAAFINLQEVLKPQLDSILAGLNNSTTSPPPPPPQLRQNGPTSASAAKTIANPANTALSSTAPPSGNCRIGRPFGSPRRPRSHRRAGTRGVREF